MSELRIGWYRLDEIEQWPRNPKKHDEKGIKSGIKRFGFIKPATIDEKTGRLVAGHGRLKVLTQMMEEGKAAPANIVIDEDGMWKMPVTRGISFKNKKEAEAFVIADNQLTMSGGWDEKLLLATIKDQVLSKKGDTTKALEGTGISPEKLSQMLAEQKESLADPPEPVIKDSEEIGRALVKKWKVEFEDVFIIKSKVKKGVEHRIMCGDSLDPDHVDKLMDGAQAALSVTSPPYWTGKEYEDQNSVDEIFDFIKRSAEQMARITRIDKSRIVINTGTGYTTSIDRKSKRHTLLLIDQWTNALYDLGWNLRHVRHWLKSGQVMSISSDSDMIDQHNEFIGTYEADQGEDMKFDDKILDEGINLLLTHYKRDGELGGRKRVDAKWAMSGVWDLKGAAGAYGHPASFPLELVRRVILMYTIFDELVVDLFVGAGTTIEACERLGRVGYGMDKEPKYVALTLQRVSDLGMSFQKVEK